MMSRFICILAMVLCGAATAGERQLGALRNSLDPLSLPQLLAFYELYPDSPEGQSALQHAWRLLSGSEGAVLSGPTPLPHLGVEAIITLVNKPQDASPPELSDEDLSVIDRLGARLHNRNLKGRTANTTSAILALEDNQIDLSRALLLAQFGDDVAAYKKIQSYEAVIDLMALQILARLPPGATAEHKIRGISQMIFYDMQFRFPPHSTYAKDIDLYTFLPSVLDSHRGVCLGVSLLYLSLAQRLDVPLEIITPPGHIFVRYRHGDKEINIETTARGIDLPSEIYLNVDTHSLQERTLREVIGLIYFNQASVFWQQKEYTQALDAYLKAKPYLPEDELLTGFLGFQYLFTGNKEEGERLLQQVRDYIPDYAVSGDTIAADYLDGKADAEAIQAVHMHVDESRESILAKHDALLKVVEKWPNFRGAIFQLAISWLQLHRTKEALETFQRYHALDGNDPTAEYYLAALYTQRLDYINAWKHLKNAEKITSAQEHHPKALKALRTELSVHFPE